MHQETIVNKSKSKPIKTQAMEIEFKRQNITNSSQSNQDESKNKIKQASFTTNQAVGYQLVSTMEREALQISEFCNNSESSQESKNSRIKEFECDQEQTPKQSITANNKRSNRNNLQKSNSTFWEKIKKNLCCCFIPQNQSKVIPIKNDQQTLETELNFELYNTLEDYMATSIFDVLPLHSLYRKSETSITSKCDSKKIRRVTTENLWQQTQYFSRGKLKKQIQKQRSQNNKQHSIRKVLNARTKL